MQPEKKIKQLEKKLKASEKKYNNLVVKFGRLQRMNHNLRMRVKNRIRTNGYKAKMIQDNILEFMRQFHPEECTKTITMFEYWKYLCRLEVKEDPKEEAMAE